MSVFWLDREAAVLSLRERAVRLLQERQDVNGVYLFGSLAEGRAVPGSDADLLILLRNSGTRILDRPLEYSHYFEDLGLPVDLFCYTMEEVERIPIAKRAASRGVLLAAQ